MARFWERMGEIYGNRWTSSFGVVGGSAFLTWAEAMVGLKPDRIAQGLRRTATTPTKKGDGWPPSLPEFLTLCRGSNEPLNASHRSFVPMLEKLPTDEEKARGHELLVQLRAGIGRKPAQDDKRRNYDQPDQCRRPGRYRANQKPGAGGAISPRMPGPLLAGPTSSQRSSLAIKTKGRFPRADARADEPGTTKTKGIPDHERSTN